MAHKSPFRTVGNFKLSDFKILKLTFTKGICKLMMEVCKIMIGYQPPIMNNVFVLRDTHIRNLQIISNEKKLSKLWVQNSIRHNISPLGKRTCWIQSWEDQKSRTCICWVCHICHQNIGYNRNEAFILAVKTCKTDKMFMKNISFNQVS